MQSLGIRMLAGLLMLATLAVPSLVQAQDAGPTAAEAFQATWARTDLPVAEGEVDRTWIWGPEPFTEVIEEPYIESPGGQRAVQYYDKARMEVTTPDADATSPWYVTTGLLATELITGQMQVGNYTFEQHLPSESNVAGDQGFPNGPSYGTFGHIYGRFMPPSGDRVNALVTHRLHRDGFVTEDASLADRAVHLAYYDDVTGHNIAWPFWDFMHATGTVWDGQQYVEDSLFLNPFYATGRPISEPYWATVQVAGTEHDVLMQCFERRCLTYTPDNAEGWQVEMGNIGQHYYAWRNATPPDVDGDLLFLRYDENEATGGGKLNLYTASLDGSNLVNLSQGIEAKYLEGIWSPDGSQVLITAQTGDFCCGNLYIVDANGENLKQLTFDGQDAQPSWSPDGEWIAFERHLGEDSSQIFVIRPDGSDEHQITGQPVQRIPMIEQARDPDWSPDGSTLVFHEIATSVPPPATSAIYTINLDGSGLTSLGEMMGVASLDWSPAGDEILVHEGQHGGRDLDGAALWLFSLSHEPEQLIGNDYRSYPANAAWSPDGSTIVFEGASGISLLDPETGETTPLTHTGSWPAWSPDGQYIAFDTRESGLIGITSLDGSEQWVVHIDGAFGAPGWRP